MLHLSHRKVCWGSSRALAGTPGTQGSRQSEENTSRCSPTQTEGSEQVRVAPLGAELGPDVTVLASSHGFIRTALPTLALGAPVLALSAPLDTD